MSMRAARRIMSLAMSGVMIMLLACKEKTNTNPASLQIAFMSDIHLQDIYGQFQDTDYKGIINPKNGKSAIIRTMDAQLHSTRIFNENYFAFLAALDDAVSRDVKYVVLTGDFSDDGQPLNVRGVKRILDNYSKKNGISFFVITGNHDPVGPFSQEAGKNDFLGKGGKAQPIMSQNGMYTADSSFEQPVIVTSDVKKLGYHEIVTLLRDYGFFPKEQYLYWETPFSDYTVDNYSFKKAVEASKFENRNYLIPPIDFAIPDVSYLVEPVDGLWLLAIDANVYIPKEYILDYTDSKNYTGASIGYNNVLLYKKHLVKWVTKIAREADKRGKKLIAFSHYPMVDFNDNVSESIKELLGENGMQLDRVPEEAVAKAFADAGIQIHFGGHMHMNDTGIEKTAKGNTLVNIQTPSLAAYVPAYKLLTVNKNAIMDVQTIVLDSVARFDELFKLYEQEYRFLESIKANPIWNRDILSSKNYYMYTSWHLKELVRLRFLPEEWPREFSDLLMQVSGKDLLVLSMIEGNLSLKASISAQANRETRTAALWNKAIQNAEKKILENGLSLEDFDKWGGEELIFDLYRLRRADELAFVDIGKSRLRQYRLLIKSFLQDNTNQSINDCKELATIFQGFMNGDPADHFQVNLNTGDVRRISGNGKK